MKKILIFLLIPISLFSQDIGGDYYVATDGNDSNDGSYSSPFLTWGHAFGVAQAGDTVYIRGGTYLSSDAASVSNSGTSFENMIYLFNYPGESPVLDCRNHYSSYNAGITVNEVQYIHIKGLEVTNVFMTHSNTTAGAISAQSSANLIFENITVHNISTGRGFHCFSGAWNEFDGEGAYFDSDTTRWINCDVYDICDTMVNEPGNAGDGWKCHNYEGNYYEWDGCRAWFYSDDGIDPSGSGTRVFKNCWVMSGSKYSSIEHFEGNGIKTAATFYQYNPTDTLANLVQMYNCLSIFCPGRGFYNNLENDDQNNAMFYNNTSYMCRAAWGDTKAKDVDPYRSIYRNNLAYANTGIYLLEVYNGNYIESNNTWDAGGSFPRYTITDTVTVTNDDFITTDSSTIVSLFLAPRDENNDLPTFPLRLSPTSDLIDAGIEIPESDDALFSITYSGSAPDIGAFEWTAGAATIPYSIGGSTPLRHNGKTLIIRQ